MFGTGIFILALYSASASIAGISLGFSESSINNYKNSSFPYYLQELPQKALFGYKVFSVAEGVLKVNVNISEPRITYITLNMPLTELNFTTNNDILVTANSLTLTVVFNWNYYSLLGKDHGQGFAYISNSNLVVLSTVANNNGSPYITAKNVDYVIQSSKLSFTGTYGSQKILNTLSELFSSRIQTEIESSIEAYITSTYVTDINTYIKSHNEAVHFSNGLSISYALTSNPVLNDTYIEAQVSGVVYVTSSPNLNPPVTGNSNLPNYIPTSSQIQVSISEYTFNTLSYSMYSQGTFKKAITSASIPSNSSIQLDTTSLDYILPGIKATYGPNLACNLYCDASIPPTVTIVGPTISKPNGDVLVNFTGECQVFVVAANQNAISFDVNLQLNTSIYVSQWVLEGQIEIIKVASIQVAQSNIGNNVNVDGMMNFLNLVANFTIPAIDEQLFGNGIPLPNLKYATMTNSTISIQSGYLYVLSTPSFNYPKAKLEIV